MQNTDFPSGNCLCSICNSDGEDSTKGKIIHPCNCDNKNNFAHINCIKNQIIQKFSDIRDAKCSSCGAYYNLKYKMKMKFEPKTAFKREKKISMILIGYLIVFLALVLVILICTIVWSIQSKNASNPSAEQETTTTEIQQEEKFTMFKKTILIVLSISDIINLICVIYYCRLSLFKVIFSDIDIMDSGFQPKGLITEENQSLHRPKSAQNNFVKEDNRPQSPALSTKTAVTNIKNEPNSKNRELIGFMKQTPQELNLNHKKNDETNKLLPQNNPQHHPLQETLNNSSILNNEEMFVVQDLDSSNLDMLEHNKEENITYQKLLSQPKIGLMSNQSQRIKDKAPENLWGAKPQTDQNESSKKEESFLSRFKNLRATKKEELVGPDPTKNQPELPDLEIVTLDKNQDN